MDGLQAIAETLSTAVNGVREGVLEQVEEARPKNDMQVS